MQEMTLGYACVAVMPHMAMALAWDNEPNAATERATEAIRNLEVDPVKLVLDGGGFGSLTVARASWQGPVRFPQPIDVVDGEATLSGPPSLWRALWEAFPGVPWSVTRVPDAWEADGGALHLFAHDSGQWGVLLKASNGGSPPIVTLSTTAPSMQQAVSALETLWVHIPIYI